MHAAAHRKAPVAPVLHGDQRVAKKERLLRVLTKLNDRDTQRVAAEELLCIVGVSRCRQLHGRHVAWCVGRSMLVEAVMATVTALRCHKAACALEAPACSA